MRSAGTTRGSGRGSTRGRPGRDRQLCVAAAAESAAEAGEAGGSAESPVGTSGGGGGEGQQRYVSGYCHGVDAACDRPETGAAARGSVAATRAGSGSRGRGADAAAIPAHAGSPAGHAARRCNCGNCDGSGRIIGGIGAVPGFRWWPIKAYRPCPGLADSGRGYTRCASARALRSPLPPAAGRPGAAPGVVADARSVLPP